MAEIGANVSGKQAISTRPGRRPQRIGGRDVTDGIDAGCSRHPQVVVHHDDADVVVEGTYVLRLDGGGTVVALDQFRRAAARAPWLSSGGEQPRTGALVTTTGTSRNPMWSADGQRWCSKNR